MYIITTLVASFLSLLFIALSLKVIMLRHRYKVSLGASGHEDLEKMIRGHGNFAEYVPIALILLLCAEANHADSTVLSILGGLLILGRLFHAWAFIFNKYHYRFRSRGMVLTLIVIACLSLLNIILLSRLHY